MMLFNPPDCLLTLVNYLSTGNLIRASAPDQVLWRAFLVVSAVSTKPEENLLFLHRLEVLSHGLVFFEN